MRAAYSVEEQLESSEPHDNTDFQSPLATGSNPAAISTFVLQRRSDEGDRVRHRQGFRCASTLIMDDSANLYFMRGTSHTAATMGRQVQTSTS